MEFKQIVGENIRHYRKINGYTLREIAEKVGITEATMQKYEAGKIGRVDVEMIQNIANAIGVTPELLTGWSTQQPLQVDYIVPTVTEDEFALIEMYRSLDKDSQDNVAGMINRFYAYAKMINAMPKGGGDNGKH